MLTHPRITLEHWRSLLAVVDAGGYAQAAELLHKSQSTVTYAVQKMEAMLGVKVFEVTGRKAHLTPTGEVLYRRAKALLEEAGALEGAAGSLAAGWEAELRLSVEIIFPTWLLLECFARFAQERPEIRLELYESVLSGTEEALLQRKVELAICSQVPPGFAGTIAIRGIPGNSIVKITEMDGRLVYQTRALGGQAVWDGRDYKGRKISSGVYLVLVSEDGISGSQKKEKATGKIVFISK